MGFVARSEAEAHCLQVNAVRVMRVSNCKGLVDPGVKGVHFKLPHPCRDIDGMGYERTGPLRPHHLQVIADHSKGGAQDTELIALHLKVLHHLSKVRGQPDRDALGLQPLGCRGSKLGLEGVDLLLRIIVLSNSLVTLLMGHAMF